MSLTIDQLLMRSHNISKEKNSIDVVINNAGYGLMGSVEDSSIDEIKAQFETNFFGAIRVMQEVIPIMRKQKTGTIVNVSSIAGRIGFPMGSAYVSSKFALEGLSESMSYELKQFGIKIVLIEPGVINTNFTFVTPKKVLDTNSCITINEKAGRKSIFDNCKWDIPKRSCKSNTTGNNPSKSRT